MLRSLVWSLGAVADAGGGAITPRATGCSCSSVWASILLSHTLFMAHFSSVHFFSPLSYLPFVVMFSSIVIPDLAIPAPPTSIPPTLPTTNLLPAAPYSSLPPLPNVSAPIRKRYACPHCPLDFPKSGNRNRHIENKHPREVGKSRLECAFCGQSFWDSNKLNKHAINCQGAPAASIAPLSPVASTDDTRPPTKPSHIFTSQSEHSSTSARSLLSTNEINTASTAADRAHAA